MDKEKNRLIAVAAVIVVIIAIVAAALVLTGGDDKGGDDEQDDVLFKLTVSSNDGGTVTPSGTTELAEGTTQTITITPGSGYFVSDVLLDGESVGAVTSLEVEMDGDHTVQVVFAEETGPALVEHTITASAGTGGRISPSGEVTVADGADQTFTFTANSSYRVSQVTVDGKTVTVTGNSYTFEDVTGDHTISVTFRYVGGGGGGGTVTPSPTLQSITIGGDYRTSYLAGEKFDATDMKVTAHYSDNTTKPVTSGYTVTPSGELGVDNTKVTVNYQGRTATIEITVIPAESEISGIEITAQPTKTHYFDDQKFDQTGIAVSAVYDGGVKIPLESTEYSVVESNGTVTVTYTADSTKTATTTVTRDNIIMDADELKHFRDNVNSGKTYSGDTVKLGANIDLQKESWTPIGLNADDSKKFQGTFDGANFTISNLNVQTETGYTAAGFFGALNGAAKDFTIDGATVSHISAPGNGGNTTNGVAVVAGSIYTSGTIQNVTVKNATVEGNRYVGGIAGYVYGSVIGCTVEDTALWATPDNLIGKYENGDKVGGIVGYTSTSDNGNYGEITNCTVRDVTISGYRNLGGIVGTSDKSPTGCTVENVTITHDRSVITETYSSGNQSGIVLGTRTFTGSADSSNKVQGSVTTDDVDVLEGAIGLSSGDLNVSLASGTYTPTSDYNIDVASGKDVTIDPVEGAEVVFDGRFSVTGSLNVSGITMNTSHSISEEASQFSLTGVALQGTGSFSAKDVRFSVTLSEGTAITSWWSTGNGTNITVTDCVFDCNGERPIRSDANVTVESCTFNDPYRYAVQMTSKVSTMTAETATVNFNDNIIIETETSDNPVYGIQLEGETYGCSDLVINGSGNRIDVGSTGRDSAMYYCECGLVECGHDPDVPSTITWNVEVDPVHKSIVSIGTVEQLMDFAESVNDGKSYEGIMIQLTDDINLTNQVWTPIGLSAQSGTVFKGTFDGQNHIISGMTIDTADTNEASAAGFFGVLSGTVKNVTFTGANINHISLPYEDMTGDDGIAESTYNGIGVVAGSLHNTGTIENVTVKDSTVNGNRYVGAIVGYAMGSDDNDVYVKNCTVQNVTLKATPNEFNNGFDNGDKVGGIIGYMGYKGVYVQGCDVSGSDITGYRNIGGIAGYVNGQSVTGCSVSDVKIHQCAENGYVDDDFLGEVAGAIAGIATASSTMTDNTSENVVITQSYKLNIVKQDGLDYMDSDMSSIEIGDVYGFLFVMNNYDGLLNILKTQVENDNPAVVYLWGWTIKLTGDIDLGNTEMAPIEYRYGPLDGGNHTISNVNISAAPGLKDHEGDDVSAVGLFQSIGNVKDLKLSNVEISSSIADAWVGSVAGFSSGTWSNVTVDRFNITSTADGAYIGGLIGDSYANISGCSVSNGEIFGGKNVGGFIGFIGAEGEAQRTVENCSASGVTIDADERTTTIGSFVGRLNSTGTTTITLTGCSVDNVTGTNVPDDRIYGDIANNSVTINGETCTKS